MSPAAGIDPSNHSADIEIDSHDCSKTGGSLWSDSAPVNYAMDVDSIGYVAAALTTMSFFPQAIKTLRTDDTRSISLLMFGLFTGGVAIWAVFGVLSGNGPVILANGFTLIPASFVLQKKIRHRLLGWER